MPANDYAFVSHWRVRGTVDEVSDIVGDATSLPRWWGSVYREVEQTDPGDDKGVGKTFTVRAVGWLPYSLRLRFRQTGERSANGFPVAVSGDLNGVGVWTFEQDGEDVAVTFEWTVRAEKALLRRFSAVMKPIFASNHYWTMRRGEESLRIELQRLHAHTPEERALVPAPPGPFELGPALLLLGVLATLTTILALLFRLPAFRRR